MTLKLLEEAVELAERFPDLPDFEVIEHVEYVHQIRILNKATEYAILSSYRAQDVEAGKVWIT